VVTCTDHVWHTRREVAHWNPLTFIILQSGKFAFPLHKALSSHSFCWIALARVNAEDRVARDVPKLITAAFVVIAVDEGELPNAAS
jgi:hypothetical protein